MALELEADVLGVALAVALELDALVLLRYRAPATLPYYLVSYTTPMALLIGDTWTAHQLVSCSRHDLAREPELWRPLRVARARAVAGG